MGSAQVPGAKVRGGLDLRGGRACSDGCPSQYLQRLKSLGREGVCNGSPTSFMPHNNDLLPWCPGLFLPTFLVVELIIPVLSGWLSTVNSCPFPWSMFQTILSSTQPSSTTGMHDSGWVVQGWGTGQACSSVCPAVHRPSTEFSFNPSKGLFYPSSFPHCCRGRHFWERELFLIFSFPAGLLAPFLIPLHFFPFFHPTKLWGNLCYSFRSPSLLPVISRCCVKIVPFVDVFLMYLWGDALLSHHLDSSPSNHYFGTLVLVLINQALNKRQVTRTLPKDSHIYILIGELSF